jgi:asparagine synthase (glutamine-hydrolysing)
MCGICGILPRDTVPLGRRLAAMADAQRHRGPDGEGFFVDRTVPLLLHDARPAGDEAGICGLGHRRLAILDPARGRQPMMSRDGGLSVVFNGEIFNFPALRRDLGPGARFETDCDTEVLLHLYERHPDDPAAWIPRLNGIFAFALWDRARRRLLLARDPHGVKPLHVAQHDGALLFASEIKALLAAGVPARLNRAALHVFMNVRYVPGESTLFDGVRRFPPGHFAWARDGALGSPRPFFRLPDADPASAPAPAGRAGRVRDAFLRAVGGQLLSDVPVGISLSGGLDSSMNVAAAAAAYRADPPVRSGDRVLRTFSLGFNEPTDELDDARLVADRFGAEHHEDRLDLNPLARMGEVIRAVEEPKINIIQGYVLSQFAARSVKVLISGLGGDELFAGYDIHRFCNTLGRGHRLVPRAVQASLLGPLGRLWWRAQAAAGPLRFEHYRIGGQIALALGDRAQFYARLRNAWDADAGMYARIYADPGAFRALPAARTYFAPYFEGGGDYLEQVLRTEFQTKMVNDFLVNEDRVTSAHGVEGRVPFLDPDLVRLAFSIPARDKMRGRETKALWKDAVAAELPPEIVRKRKQGFTFSSYHQWTKDLRGAVERELTPDWCAGAGLFNHGFIRTLLDTPPHPNLRWHYFMAWMMLGTKHWMEIFHVRP